MTWWPVPASSAPSKIPSTFPDFWRRLARADGMRQGEGQQRRETAVGTEPRYIRDYHKLGKPRTCVDFMRHPGMPAIMRVSHIPEPLARACTSDPCPRPRQSASLPRQEPPRYRASPLPTLAVRTPFPRLVLTRSRLRRSRNCRSRRGGVRPVAESAEPDFHGPLRLSFGLGRLSKSSRSMRSFERPAARLFFRKVSLPR